MCRLPSYYDQPFPPRTYPDLPESPIARPMSNGFEGRFRFDGETAHYRTIWMVGEEPAGIELDFAIGLDGRTPVGPWYVLPYLDHRPLLVDVGGTEVTRIPVVFGTDLIATVRFVVPPARVPEGAHALNLVLEQHVAHELTAETLSSTSAYLSFVVFHDGYDWPHYDSAPGAEVVAADSSTGSYLRAPGGTLTRLDLRDFPPPEGRLPVRLRLRNLDQERLRLCSEPLDVGTVALVALLDGAPFSLGPLDGALVANVPGESHYFYDLELVGLPVDALPHSLDIIAFSGLTAAANLDAPFFDTGQPGYSAIGGGWTGHVDW